MNSAQSGKNIQNGFAFPFIFCSKFSNSTARLCLKIMAKLLKWIDTAAVRLAAVSPKTC
jgi:hypothetical protein